jgi:hypothetical protein
MNNRNEIMQPQWNKKLPYKVPESYFDELPGKIQQRIREQQSESQPRMLWPVLKPYLTMAAMLLLIAGGTWISVRYFSARQQQNLAATVETEADKNMTIAAAIYFDENQLAEAYIETKNIKKTEKNTSAEQIVISEDVNLNDIVEALN